jgi:peptidoglycan pentaglycine glycine transferase (the first glycine)
MKPKTRYNIRLAERKGVTVRPAALDELPLLYRMYAETSLRDGFVIRSEDYYLLVWQTFMEKGLAVPLLAEVAGQPVAGLVLFMFSDMAWYLYGMSTGDHREKMPNHLLQWEAMRIARQRGCVYYDLWGAPNVFDESDSMWGVYRFKEGLGGEVVRTIGAWDFLSGRTRYTLFMRVLPRILDLMRRRRKASTRQEVSG